MSLPNCKLAAQFSLSTHLVGIFLKQNYPKYISDVLLKILEKKEHNYQMFCLNLRSSWNWASCVLSWKSLLPIFIIFHRTDFGGFLVCCLIAIQQLNGVEKNSVAITLMLNQNLTGLFGPSPRWIAPPCKNYLATGLEQHNLVLILMLI